MSSFTVPLLLTLTVGLACSSPSTSSDANGVSQDLVKEVRADMASGDVASAEERIEARRAEAGNTPTVLLAQSWVARGALAAKDLDKAAAVARRTYDEASGLLSARPLDEEPQLPLALGASIEVLAQAAGERGARSEAIAYLEGERAKYADTSMFMRIQKNINLLSLEGTRAPELTAEEFIGAAPPSLESLEGRVVIMFFWAHWCADCKAQGPILARLADKYGPQGLTLLAPTQRYGYVAAGKDAPSDEEAAYISSVWASSYAALEGTPVSLDAANHRRYGVSTTPTLVMVDRAGLIRLYHPGLMSEAELEPLVAKLVASS